MFHRASLFILFAATLPAEVKLPALLSDHMLLQQDMPVRIWGKATPGEAITVSIPSQRISAKADADGKWQAFLRPMKPGAPFAMTVAGTNTIVIQDVLVGEVWVGSGQSNMEFPMSRVMNAPEEIAKATHPDIRLFTVKRMVSETPKDDVEGAWAACTPESVKNFSAVAYFFGREIAQTQKVPVGLIHTSWGGTPAQSWTEHSSLADDAALHDYLTNWQKNVDAYPAKKDAYDAQLTKWQEAVQAAKTAGKTAPNRPAPPLGPGHPNTPSGLYNAMIAPLTPYAIRGALWYQGESNANANESLLYRRLFANMIQSWRQEWAQGSFPFYFVQLANYRTNGWWPLLRESQTATLELRNTGMALAIDVGNPTDIHPTNKQEVGHRLALSARAQTYGEKIEFSGPLYREMTTQGTTASIWFDHADGLTAKNGTLAGFSIAGPDRKFYPAEARVEGSTVAVTSPNVLQPTAVRYDWQDDPAVTLYNKEGLPASSFRTDVWKDAKSIQ